MNVGIIGIIASLLLISSSMPQVWLCYKQGHAEGVSSGMLWLWFLGMCLMGIYVSLTRGGDWVLFSNYGINICFILIIMKYKYFQRATISMIFKKLLMRIYRSI